MINSAEGAIEGWWDIAWPWPPQAQLRAIRVGDDRAWAEVQAEADGSFRLVVFAGGAVRSVRSQPVHFTGRDYIALGGRWSATDTTLFVNGEPLAPANAEGAARRQFVPVQAPPGTKPAWDDPEAAARCAARVAWRATRFAASATLREGATQKPPREQAGELARARLILTDLADAVASGRHHSEGHLAAELRALVYWPGDEPKPHRAYNPLLLRLAGRASLPLPIYAAPADPFPRHGLMLAVETGHPSIERQFPGQVLLDLQDWLVSPALTTASRAVDARNVIAAVADAQGAAHYDEGRPAAVDQLGLVRGVDGSGGATILLLHAADVVGRLAAFVSARYGVQ